MTNDVDEAVRKSVGASIAFVTGSLLFILAVAALFELGPGVALVVISLVVLVGLFAGASRTAE